MTQKTVEINITGIIMGVGFRPFLFNLAKYYGLNGFILNRGNAGVRLVVQGNPEKIEIFIKKIQLSKPKIAYIEELTTNQIQSKIEYNKLEIIKSEDGRGISLALPPDIATCTDCIRDMRNIDIKKYFNYPFIACAVCGPRFSTVTALPYDRERTTMINFPFCEEAEPQSCTKEYNTFTNRRFHAQTFACSVCGPNYKLYDKNKNIIHDESIEEILLETAKRINRGEIGAVQGIGGVHLVCLAEDDNTVLKLRSRKGNRKFKPFAIMVPNIELIKNEFRITEKEEQLLKSFRRPILLLERKKSIRNSIISKYVAPGLSNIGVMLPYTGIHYLLFDYIGEKPLVYTSGNKSNIPMGIENEMIFDQLHELADFFLLHNRPIFQRVDDSVLRLHDDKIKLIRRSRGYVPEYIPIPIKVDIQGAISTGPELTTTGALLRGNRIFPTQHIGNTTHLETYEFLKDAIFHMKNLLKIKDSEISFISCDAHPAFISTKLGNELASYFNVQLYRIQHHFAHILSLMAENNVKENESIVGISVDGVGYGDDGNVWGGEILICSYNDYKRAGHLQYQPMIGGDRCTKYPGRMLASIILNSLEVEDAIKTFKTLNLKNDLEYQQKELEVIISQFKSANKNYPDQNIPLSSSAGRIFDCVSYILGASTIKTYRGEPAMRLEGLAINGNSKNIDLDIKYFEKNGVFIIDSSDLILQIINLKESHKNSQADIAAAFQTRFGQTFAEIAMKVASKNNIDKIGLSGGVAYNYSFSNSIKTHINENGYIFLEHDIIPPGDAGISTGQLVGGLFNHLKQKS
ncbi:MAG: carbamoyltransferase HypF [Candidatus Hermodarchaeota archaeon]